MTGVHMFGFERYVSFTPTHQRRVLIEFHSCITARADELRTSMYYSGENVTDPLRFL